MSTTMHLLKYIILLLFIEVSGAKPHDKSKLEDIMSAVLKYGQREISTSEQNGIANVTKARVLFLRMNPGAGLGNRFVALISGFFLSLLSDRIFIVDWEDYHDVRVHRSKEVSTMSGLNHFVKVPFRCDSQDVFDSVEKQRLFGWDYDQWAHIHDEDIKLMAAFRDTDINTLLPQRVVAMTAISYFGKLLLLNPAYETRLHEALGENPFLTAAYYLLRPADSVQEQVSRYYLQHFAGRRVVGVHLRTIEYMSQAETEAALRCAAFLSPDARPDSVFVASDTPEGMETARRVLGDGFLRYERVAPGRAGRAALEDGWINALLLSRTDAMVATARSSFALLAAGLAGGAQNGRPLYEVNGEECVKVLCEMPMLQRDHPLARAGLANYSHCLAASRAQAVRVAPSVSPAAGPVPARP